MRECAKSTTTWVKVGLGALPLLVLAGCSVVQLPSGAVFDDHIDRGPTPHTSVVFCDIENADADKVRRCATEADNAQWNEALKDLRGDNMRMRTGNWGKADSDDAMTPSLSNSSPNRSGLN